MEADQSLDVEMTEAAPKLYDIIHPTPVSLKELSAMEVILKIWRREVNEYRTSRKLRNFENYKPRIEITRIKTILPDLHCTIYKTIEKLLTSFVDSFVSWLREHLTRIFDNYYAPANCILKYFDDFVLDYDGSIHYTKTAERMIRCVGFDADIKFKIACLYFFEDDIRRIWPSVSRQLRDFASFRKFPQLYYWIYHLRKEAGQLPISTIDWFNNTRTVDEKMFNMHMPRNRPLLEYFWNRIPVEKQIERARHVNVDQLDFVRFFLPKLTDRQLDELVNSEHHSGGFYTLFRRFHRKQDIVLRIWSYIRSKNIMDKSTFTRLVVDFILDYGRRRGERDEFDYKSWDYLCSKIWNDSPLDFKQSAISFISSDIGWLEHITIRRQIHVEFLLLILQYASLKERYSFWHTCWKKMIEAVRPEDLQRMTQLCLKNEGEITQFKQNFIFTSEEALQVCLTLLEYAHFDDLNAYVSFCCPKSQAARNFKERILRSAFLSENGQLPNEIVCEAEKFGHFVEDVSTDVKNRLIASRTFLFCLSRSICREPVPLEKLAGFIDIFASTEDALKQIKMSLIEMLKEYVTTCLGTQTNRREDVFVRDDFNSTLLWILGSNEAVEEFKLSCTP
ncbi:uncharacterized protein LOC135847739 isoform X4 [Planococcus citri]|uniref:uncharacterized protein LOC135847739 isoform X4 n=1 Tax=Planococcus citri TaxID=170843 RepID=UPI0031F8FCA8